MKAWYPQSHLHWFVITRKQIDDVEAKTPYQRVLDSSHVDEASKEWLRQEYASLNPVALLW
jgi:hypothetical protein